MPCRETSSADDGCYKTRLWLSPLLSPSQWPLLILGPSAPLGQVTAPPHHEARPKALSFTHRLWHGLWTLGWHTLVLSRLDGAGNMQAGEEPGVRALSSECSCWDTQPFWEPLQVPGPRGRGVQCAPEEGAAQGCPTNCVPAPRHCFVIQP